jgi:hypothetical protein
LVAGWPNHYITEISIPYLSGGNESDAMTTGRMDQGVLVALHDRVQSQKWVQVKILFRPQMENRTVLTRYRSHSIEMRAIMTGPRDGVDKRIGGIE